MSPRESGRGDLNPRPQRPERCALTKLRYFPFQPFIVQRAPCRGGTRLRSCRRGHRQRRSSVLVAVARQKSLYGGTSAEGVKRLEQPTGHSGALGQERVRLAVQQKQHGNRTEAAGESEGGAE